MTEKRSPRVDDAPGLIWRKRANGWAAIWQCRSDLAERGYEIKSRLIMIVGACPSDTEKAIIADKCRELQDAMLLWGRDAAPCASVYTGTLTSLIACYKSDPDAGYQKARYKTRVSYEHLCRRIETDHGDELIRDIRAKTLIAWHRVWSESGVTAAHSLVSQLRKLIGYGLTMLEDDECARLRVVLREMKFKMGKPRTEAMTAAQASGVRTEAHKAKVPSIALAQAFQFECTLRQKDVIGEWVPHSEMVLSLTLKETRYADRTFQRKWLRGIVWQEIDPNLILRHVTSKRQKLIEPDLKNAPMVLEELALQYPGSIEINQATLAVIVRRDLLPSSGPVIVSEDTKAPWGDNAFRRRWRTLARRAGVPDHVQNMDSRAGAITEALASGARLESVRKAATHSDQSMTQRYSRGDTQEIAEVMQLRAANRNKSRT